MEHQSRPARLFGGPLDGRVVPVEEDGDELLVTMADGSVHRYRRTGSESPSSTDDTAVFTWTGRASS